MNDSWRSQEKIYDASVLDRRRFLIAAGLATAGLALTSMPAYASPIFDALTKFADAVGATPVAGTIDDYLKGAGVPKNLALAVNGVNSSLKRSGFTDVSQSPVYVPAAEENYFFFPVRHKDQFNVIVNFFDRGGGKRPHLVCSLDGPTLLGVGELAAVVTRRNSKAVAKQALLPRKKIRIISLRMDKSYKQPNVYGTDSGTVHVGYKTDGKGKGTVTVEAKDRRGILLAGGDYDLFYRADA